MTTTARTPHQVADECWERVQQALAQIGECNLSTLSSAQAWVIIRARNEAWKNHAHDLNSHNLYSFGRHGWRWRDTDLGDVMPDDDSEK